MARHRNNDAVTDDQLTEVVAELVKITTTPSPDFEGRVRAGETVLAYAFEFDGAPVKAED